jgi:hypothetical protein
MSSSAAKSASVVKIQPD